MQDSICMGRMLPWQTHWLKVWSKASQHDILQSHLDISAGVEEGEWCGQHPSSAATQLCLLQEDVSTCSTGNHKRWTPSRVHEGWAPFQIFALAFGTSSPSLDALRLECDTYYIGFLHFALLCEFYLHNWRSPSSEMSQFWSSWGGCYLLELDSLTHIALQSWSIDRCRSVCRWVTWRWGTKHSKTASWLWGTWPGMWLCAWCFAIPLLSFSYLVQNNVLHAAWSESFAT